MPEQATPPTDAPWRRLLRTARPRPTKANLLATVLALALGFAIATQVRQTSSADLSSLREGELVRILDDIQQDNSRLGNELRELQDTRDKLLTGAATSGEARAAAQARLDTLRILAGTVAATGPGITITIDDEHGGVTAPLLLDALEELRDAGAEAIQVGDVRVVASSYLTDGEQGGILLSGKPIAQPYTIKVIGDTNTLASAMDIPGGVTESVRLVDAKITVTRHEELTISALHTIVPPRYARPEPAPTTPAS